MFERLVIVGGDGHLAVAARTIGLATDVHTSLDGVGDADAVAVLAGARPDPARVANALRPGGVVYWEVDRTRLRSAAVSPTRIAGRLAASGLTVQSAYALRPHPSRCELFLPLHEPEALRWFLDDVYVASTCRQVLGEHAVRLLTRGGRRLARLVPFHATIATLRPRTGLTVAERGAAAISSIGFGSTAMLTDSGNRAVMICFPRGEAATTVIKVPKLPAFAARTAAEQRVTTAIREVMGPDAESIPRPLGTFDVGAGVIAGVEAAATGSSPRRAAISARPPIGSSACTMTTGSPRAHGTSNGALRWSANQWICSPNGSACRGARPNCSR